MHGLGFAFTWICAAGVQRRAHGQSRLPIRLPEIKHSITIAASVQISNCSSQFELWKQCLHLLVFKQFISLLWLFLNVSIISPLQYSSRFFKMHSFTSTRRQHRLRSSFLLPDFVGRKRLVWKRPTAHGRTHPTYPWQRSGSRSCRTHDQHKGNRDSFPRFSILNWLMGGERGEKKKRTISRSSRLHRFL